MKVSRTDELITAISAAAIVVGYTADTPPEGPTAEADAATNGAISKLIEAGEITGKAAEVVSILAPAGLQTTQLVVVGLGPADSLDRGSVTRAIGSAAKHLAAKERSRVAFFVGDWDGPLVEAGVSAAICACQGQDIHRETNKLHPFDEIRWSGAPEGALEAGQVLGESVNLTRRLVNEPANYIFPQTFAEQAGAAAADAGLEVEVWDQAKLEAERCGSLLGVSRGSTREPRLVILRYHGGAADQPPLALVGKGVTFDSGGYSLKPNDSMKTMKCDMGGAATVLGAITAIARLKLPVNVIGLMGLVENMVSGDAFKLGDVLTARSGKTIEVLNTDAEGRLVLADVLDVAAEMKPGGIIDLATLTGACCVALGLDVAGLMTNDEELRGRVSAAAAACGELTWELPMFDHFGEQIRSDVADIKNIGEGRWGGAMTAAKFLEEFVGDTPWTHIDIAGPAFLDSAKSWIDAGGSGAMVRTLVEVARDW